MISKNETRKYKNFGLNLFRIREEKRMTRQQLAEEIGLKDQRIIYDYENGFKFPSFKRFIRLGVVLEVSLDSMVE